jgi:hypothetical protein
VSQNSDTRRLDWIIERILVDRLYPEFGISDTDLEGSGDISMGALFREAVDRKIAEENRRQTTT